MTRWGIKCLSVVVLSVVLTACGGSTQSSTVPTFPTTAASGAATDFCRQLTNIEHAIVAAAQDTQASQAKQDYQKVLNLIEGVTNVPPSLKSNMAAAISDLKSINNWFQAQGAPTNLKLTSVPAAIATPVANLVNVATPIVNYAKTHCGSSHP